MSLSPVQDAIKDHFFIQECQCLRRAVAFVEAEMWSEGWFKGELVYLLSKLRKTGIIKSWEKEVLSTRDGKSLGNCDFKVELVNLTAIIEVKTEFRHWKGTDYALSNIADKFPKDIEKMLAIQAARTSYYLLLFAYPIYVASEWPELAIKIQKVAREGTPNVKGNPNVLIDVSRVDDSPEGELSIGWLHVSKQA